MISKIIKTLLLLTFFKVTGFAQSSTIIVPNAHTQKISRIVIDAVDKYFYTADDVKVIMWNFKTMRQLYSFTIANKSTKSGIGSTISSLKELIISPDGNVLAFTTVKDSLKIFSTLTGKILQTIPSVYSKIIFSKDSKTIYDMVPGPAIPNRSNGEGRIVRSINIATGDVKEHWYLKDLNIWGAHEKYFFPLTNSRVINFNEKGYQILDLDNKTEVATMQISEEAKKKSSYPERAFNEYNFKVYPESGLFVFQQYRNQELGWATWDIYANKEFAFMPAYAEINMQSSSNTEKILYITRRGTRYNKQELVIYSRGYKIEKKKLLNISDEIYVAGLGKKNKTVIYADYNNKLYKANVDNDDKETILKGLPEIKISSFNRDGDMLSFNASTVVSDNINQGTFENYKSDYIIDLKRALLYAHDTVPTFPTNAVTTIRLNKDSFLLEYQSFAKGDNTYFLYDKTTKKRTPFQAKEFGIINNSINWEFSGIPQFFTLSTPGLAYYTAGDYGTKETDPYTCNLYKYNVATKKSEKIFTALDLPAAKWVSLGGGSTDKPRATQQLIMDRKSEILAAAEYDAKGAIQIIDIKTGKIIARHPFEYDAAVLRDNYKNNTTFEKQGNDYRPFIIKQVRRINNEVVKVLGSETLYEFNVTNGLVKEKKFIDGSMFDYKTNVNIVGNHTLTSIVATYEDDKETVVKTVFGDHQFKLDRITSPVTRIEFTENDSILYTIHADKSMNAYNAITGKFYGTLYVFENSTDWVFVDANGRFDGTDIGMKRLYYLKGREVINLDKVYEKYYTPNLFQRLTNGEQFAPIPQNDLKPKPSGKILYVEKKRNLEVEEDTPTYANTTGVAEITVVASAPDDTVDEIRLFHNGKVITVATRGMFVTDNDGADSKKYTVNLLPGQNNFRAVVLNSERTESDADEILVNYTGSTNNTPVEIKPDKNNAATVAVINKNATLHLIVVGINEYQNKSMSLNYALADATSFKEEVEKDAKTIISTIKTYFVTNSTADKTGITNAFKEVQQNAKAQDVFIFYYAGHGVIGKDKEFYLVPTNVSDLKNVQAELEQKGIASKQLQQYAIDIQAQKQLFILDACQSAGAFEKLLTNDGDQQKTLAVVARSTGTHWMAASGAMQYANEFSTLGHGAFTYVLLQALKGEAANNKMITVNGLKSFLQVQVPLLMKKYNGAAQYPASYGQGNDFPVELIK
jgi:WD40 repeat protein